MASEHGFGRMAVSNMAALMACEEEETEGFLFALFSFWINRFYTVPINLKDWSVGDASWEKQS